MRSAVGIAMVAMTLGGCLSLVSCATGEGGSASSTGSNAAPADPIPPVREGRSLAGIPPCQLFTQQQLQANRIDQPGQPKDANQSPGCEWRDGAYTREIKIFTDLGHDVLSNTYAQRSMFAVLEVTQVAGHPAIRTKDSVDGTSCYFRVAAAERQTFTIRFTSLRDGREEPCGPAAALAADVLKNLPPLKG